jgi:hypothetical protein
MKSIGLWKKEVSNTVVVTNSKVVTNPLQRKAINEEEKDDLLQMKKSPVQLMEGLDEEEPLQKQHNPLQYRKSHQNPLQLKQAANNLLQVQKEKTKPIQKSNNTGLPDNLKVGIEALSGYNMDDVKVHYNSDKPAQLQALAYAQGSDIHIAPGQEQYLPHEAWHVVQQKQGRVQATIQMKEGVTVNDDIRLEREADVMGDKINGTNGKTASLTKDTTLRSLSLLPVQRVREEDCSPEDWRCLNTEEFKTYAQNKYFAPKGAKYTVWLINILASLDCN